VQIDYIFVLI